MHGLIGKITAVTGERDNLTAVLLEAVPEMPGCLSYIVAHDPEHPDVLWITEVWDTRASHQASLGLPRVKRAIARGKPLIVSFDMHVETVAIGGQGL